MRKNKFIFQIWVSKDYKVTQIFFHEIYISYAIYFIILTIETTFSKNKNKNKSSS